MAESKATQRLIEKLQQDVAYFKAQAYRAANVDLTDTVVLTMGEDGHARWTSRGLPPGSTVRFNGMFDVRVLGVGIEITSAGADPIEVHPRGVNQVRIRAEKDWHRSMMEAV